MILKHEIDQNKGDEELFRLVQRMFIFDNDFDKGMIWLIRNSIKNFIESNQDCSINGLPLNGAAVADDPNID